MADQITVTGLVKTALSLDYAGLAALPEQISDVSNLAPGREGVAVRFEAVLKAAGVDPSAGFITLEAEGDFAASIPLAPIIDQALIWYGLKGGPLPRDKGGPIRFLIPNPAACGTADIDQCANVKWLQSIDVSAERGRDVRPSTLRAHEELHERENQQGQGGVS